MITLYPGEIMGCGHPYACMQYKSPELDVCRACVMQDEAVAAVVEEIAETVKKACGTMIGTGKSLAATIRALKPNAPQILAERDKRTIEDWRKEREERIVGCYVCGNQAPMKERYKYLFCEDHKDISPLRSLKTLQATVQEAEARMRYRMQEPSPCGVSGHVRANCNFSYREGYDGELRCCDACAQQRELWEALEYVLKTRKVECEHSPAKPGVSNKKYYLTTCANCKARRALGEKS